MLTAYRAARVFDGVSEGTSEDAVVVVRDGRIVSVIASNNPPAQAELVDLGDATLLPGLIDAHVHLVWSASAEPHEVVSRECGLCSRLLLVAA
jgi:imidazolonepropionase-like amidohydrolase